MWFSSSVADLIAGPGIGDGPDFGGMSGNARLRRFPKVRLGNDRVGVRLHPEIRIRALATLRREPSRFTGHARTLRCVLDELFWAGTLDEDAAECGRHLDAD